jgi:hypothetical protein
VSRRAIRPDGKRGRFAIKAGEPRLRVHDVTAGEHPLEWLRAPGRAVPGEGKPRERTPHDTRRLHTMRKTHPASSRLILR